MRVETAAEQLFFSTVRIDTEKSVGTGFIVSHQWDDRNHAAFLVTNKHVVDGSAQGLLRLHQGEEIDGKLHPSLRKTFDWTITGEAWDWKGHPEQDIDVAVLGLGTLFNQLEKSGHQIFFRHIPTSIFPTQAALEELDAIEGVTFIGYPNGMFDEANNLPIARLGSTATPASVDYCGDPVFLIDASVFPGSSGSPVFICNVGSWAGRHGVTIGSRLIFLGILASVFVQHQDGKIRINKAVASGNSAATFSQMIDLGVVFKSRTVLDTILHALRLEGQAV
ncbi:MAG: trypsin-like peptidase domain-containing protein [Dehalococcoidia bacterium]|nr:trypsin-like peptidase domain-containing protein [Dehalococcoidia bacterium]